MSVGFLFTSDISDCETFLYTLKDLARQSGYTYTRGDDWARVNFCRMGELEFSFEPEEDNPEGDLILTAECVTSLAGAGFHAAAIDFTDLVVRETGIQIDMDDETEYYEHRNFQRLRQEHFYPWLTTLVDLCRQEGENSALSNFCVCWDLDQYVPEDIPGTVVTPFGRYHIAQLVDQVQNEGIEVFAREFFIWNEREQNGRFFLNTAMSILWEDCCFMPSDRSERDRTANQTFLSYLERAASMDVSLPMPKAEYELVCRLDGRTPIDLTVFPDYLSDYPIGYRRRPVVHRLGNTDITIPGHFLRDEEDSDIVWYDDAQGGWHSLRASAFRISEGEAEFSERLFLGLPEDPTEFKAGDGRGKASFAGKLCDDEDDSIYYQSIAQIVCARQVTLLTASYERPEDKGWAMELFLGIRSFRKVEI